MGLTSRRGDAIVRMPEERCLPRRATNCRPHAYFGQSTRVLYPGCPALWRAVTTDGIVFDDAVQVPEESRKSPPRWRPGSTQSRVFCHAHPLPAIPSSPIATCLRGRRRAVRPNGLLPGRWLAGSRPGAGACWTTTLRRKPPFQSIRGRIIRIGSARRPTRNAAEGMTGSSEAIDLRV
jgi:hypothetical protein